MNLTAQLLGQITSPNVDRNERAHLRCQISKQLEEAGNYEQACTVMGELWRGIGERPVLDGLNKATAAEVLLQVGRLTTCVGSVRQIDGSHEIAKELINESITIFESLNETKKVAEAQSEIAVCYWRLAEYDEARSALQKALSVLTDEDIQLKALTLLRTAIVEKLANRLNDALRILTNIAPLFEGIENHTLKGRFHNEFAQVLRKLYEAEARRDYIDQALFQYTAASFHFEQAGHTRYRAHVEKNMGFLFHATGKFAEAHEHLDRAYRLFLSLKETEGAAQVDEIRACALLEEGRYAEAAEAAQRAAERFEENDEKALLTEALTTRGKALARLGAWEQAKVELERAIKVTEEAGTLEDAGKVGLTMIEELGQYLAPIELCEIYQRADELLGKSQERGVLARLRSCARRVMDIVDRYLENASEVGQVEEGEPEKEGGEAVDSVEDEKRDEEGIGGSAEVAVESWEGFSLRRKVQEYEERVIERALRDAGGVVSRAAQLLGFKHHHSLIAMLKGRHRKLLPARSPIVPRKRSIIGAEREEGGAEIRGGAKSKVIRGVRVVRILYAEDERAIVEMVRETLRFEGWRVEVCEDGWKALKRIESRERYDLLLVDNELPGVSGMELVKKARTLRHWRRVPVVMLSAGDNEREALEAGADAFLRKPEDILVVVETIARLLARRRRSLKDS